MNKQNRVPLVSMDGDYFNQLKQSTCPYCGVGCGIEVSYQRSENKESLRKLSGTANHPANYGRLCVKGSHLLETLTTTNRLLHPQIQGKKVDWETATQDVASRIANTDNEYGPESVAFYVSGQLLTEDYYVANKLIKGFIGTANIDTNSRLCMSSAVASYKRAFGEDVVPCNYQDVEFTDLLILIGSNAAWTHPVLFQRIERAKKINLNMQVVVIDPRQTASCSIADLHLAIRPGTDAALFNGLLNYLANNDHIDRDYIEKCTQGFENALASSDQWNLEQTAHYCDIPSASLLSFYQAFASSETAVSFYSMGINQSNSGVDKGNGIINCHLATGKIGKKGCGPFSITGQPNAMGGREVGGLANMLAAHMDFGNPLHEERVARFWNTENLATQEGLKAVDLFNAIDEEKIKFIWIMATNPVVSMPNRPLIERALRKCPHVVVSDVALNSDTLDFADVILPASAWAEKDGTVTNSERRISRQRQLTQPIGEAKPDWQIICEVAKKLGFEEEFSYQHPAEIFDEHARLTAFENDHERALNLSGLVGLSLQEYERLEPIQWPVSSLYPQGCERLFTNGEFSTVSGKAHFVPIHPAEAEQQPCNLYPFILNSGRYRDQWHTMTRTGNATALLKHADQPSLEINPKDAASLAITTGDLVKITAKHNPLGSAILPVKISQQMTQGQLFAPIHWSKTWGNGFTLSALFSGAHDPISGQPELKHGAVSIERAEYQQYAQFSSAHPITATILDNLFDYWQRIPGEHHTSYLIAHNSQPILPLLSQYIDHDEVTSANYCNLASKIFFKNSLLTAMLWLDSKPIGISFDWLDSLFKAPLDAELELPSLLRGSPSETYTQGPTICSCFNVQQKTIEQQIKQGTHSVEALGDVLKCGTNCGSCRSELDRILEQTLALTPFSKL
jgi:assimilatory nitrate reductase catalytic subunit